MTIGRMGAVGAPALFPNFSPEDISGLSNWYEGDQSISGLSNGSPIVTLNDLSGNNRHATAVQATRRPTYVESALNGLPGWGHNSVDEQMLVAPIDPAISGDDKPNTIFVLAKRSSSVNMSYGGFTNSGGVGAHLFSTEDGEYTVNRVNEGLTSVVAAGGTVDMLWRLLAVQFNGTAVRVWQGGGSPVVSAPLDQVALAGLNELTIGGWYGTYLPMMAFNGQYVMFTTYARKLTGAEIDTFGDAYADKYGLSWAPVSSAL